MAQQLRRVVLMVLVCLLSLSGQKVAAAFLPAAASPLHNLPAGEHLQDNRITVSGKVSDAKTGEAIVGASVYLENTNTGTSTDGSGNYKLTIKAGSNTLVISYLGYQKQTKAFTSQNDVTLNVQLSSTSVTLTEVGVTGGKQPDANIRDVQSGISSIDIKTIKTTPAFMGEADVVKSIKLLPGVSSVGEAATGFNVRGGSTDQNLVLLDDAPIFNSSHLFGFFSVFNPDAVESVTLYRGSVPAQFGGRISSVLDVKQREGDRQDYIVTGGVGLVSGRLAVEGPIVREKSSFIVAGRASYSDWLLQKMPDVTIRNSSASFYDLSAKVSHTFNGKSKVSLNGYRSYDQFGFSGDTLYNWNTNAATLKYTYLFSDNFWVDVTGVYTDYNFKVNAEEPVTASEYSNGIQLKNIKADFALAGGRHQVNFGASVTAYDLQQGKLEPTTAESEVVPVQLQQEHALESAVYWNNEVKVSSKLSFMYGIRYSLYSTLGAADVYVYEPDSPKKDRTITDTLNYSSGEIIETYHGPEPRLSLNYTINDRSAVKLAYNRSRQYLHLISNTTSVSPTDIWKSSNRYIKPQIGDQLSLGYFRNFAQNTIEASVEGYYKQLENILDYKNGANLYLNSTLEADLLSGTGRAYGVEASINKVSGRLTGWANYTYARTEVSIKGPTPEETINQGNYYPASYDKPHTLNIVSSYKLKERMTLSANFTYSTGRPITAPVAHYVIDDYVVPDFGERNQYRIPDYHRLDLSLSILANKAKQKRWEGTWNLSVYNVYGRNNPYSVFFKQVYGSPPRAYQLAVVGAAIPSISYDFKFR